MRLRSSVSRPKDNGNAPSLYSLIEKATKPADPNADHQEREGESPVREMYVYAAELDSSERPISESEGHLPEPANWPGPEDDASIYGLSDEDDQLAAQLRAAVINLEATVEYNASVAQIFTIMGIDVASECAVFAANFATVCARSGYRTLLVDANLQSPIHDTLLGVTNDTGVSDFLESTEPASTFIRRTQIAGLSLMPAGNLYKNPASLLDRERLTHRLQSAARSFDLILLEGGSLPPQVASRVAVGSTGAIFVARKGGSSLRQLQQLQAMLEVKGARAAGVVIVD